MIEIPGVRIVSFDWSRIDEYMNIVIPRSHLGKERVRGVWLRMLDRCYLDKRGSEIYKRNNIQVCDDWRFCFETFYNWSVTTGYTDDLTIDRIHNDLNYQPNNCRWVTPEDNRKYRGEFSRPEIGF